MMNVEEEGIEELEWNVEIASVAREHSFNLAKQNAPLTERDLLCYYPLVHHEGFDFGTYHTDRLENKSIFNFGLSGENIFLASAWKARKTFDAMMMSAARNSASQKGLRPLLKSLKKESTTQKT